MKQKEGKSIRFCAGCMVFTFDHTHELDLVISRSKFELALFEKWGVAWGWGWEWGWWLIDMEPKSCESIANDHDHHLWVIMVG